MSLALEAFAEAWGSLAPTSMAAIKAEVAARHGLTVADLEGPSRARAIAHPRFAAIWMCRQQTNPGGRPRWSLATIGQHFGGRDHTSVLHAVRRHEQLTSEAANG